MLFNIIATQAPYQVSCISEYQTNSGLKPVVHVPIIPDGTSSIVTGRDDTEKPPGGLQTFAAEEVRKPPHRSAYFCRCVQQRCVKHFKGLQISADSER